MRLAIPSDSADQQKHSHESAHPYRMYREEDETYIQTLNDRCAKERNNRTNTVTYTQ